jgi:hypothetical protein
LHQLRHRLKIIGINGYIGAQFRCSGVARRNPKRFAKGTLRYLPGECMFSPSTSKQQNFHGFSDFGRKNRN